MQLIDEKTKVINNHLCFLRRIWWSYHFLIKNQKAKQKTEKADWDTFCLKESIFQGCVASIIFSSEILEAVPMDQEEKDAEHPSVFSQQPVTEVLVSSVRKEKWVVRGVSWKNKNSFISNLRRDFTMKLWLAWNSLCRADCSWIQRLALSLPGKKGVHHHS